MMGIFIPLCTLAVVGLGKLVKSTRLFSLLTTLLIMIILPTNLIVLLASVQWAARHDSQLYITKEEYQAYQWIEANTAPDSLFLAAPDTGLFIPGYTGRRVFYGHPFETPNAEQELNRVRSFFLGEFSKSSALINQTDYLFIGPRERAIGWKPFPDTLSVAYKNPAVTIYQINVTP
jgi:hypothetical protein